jgi:hypothetical protein
MHTSTCSGVSFEEGLTLMAAKSLGVDPELALAAGQPAK